MGDDDPRLMVRCDDIAKGVMTYDVAAWYRGITVYGGMLIGIRLS